MVLSCSIILSENNFKKLSLVSSTPNSKIHNVFSFFQDPMEKIEQLIDYGKMATGISKDLKTEPIFIRGFGDSNSHSSINYMPNMEHLEIATISSKKAFDMAKLTAKDIDLKPSLIRRFLISSSLTMDLKFLAFKDVSFLSI